jgi:hypothetical protein
MTPHVSPTRLPLGRPISPLRAAFDFYVTPVEATRALLSVEDFDGPIWEPACGDGAISRELIAAGHEMVSTDIADRGYGVAGVDFLEEGRARAKHIFTNPPYGRGLADRFIGQALRLTRATGGSVVMLLDLASLCHPRRHAKFVNTPPAAIYALDECVCIPNGVFNRAILRDAQMRFCWVVWKPGHTGRPGFWWLSTRPFRTARPQQRNGLALAAPPCHSSLYPYNP